jgi:tRNA pseudouridine38-40 synthase
VHAEGQVVHFDLTKPHSPGRIRDGVNTLLPWDARLLAVDAAHPEFHARRDAAWKEYLYRWSRPDAIAPRDALFVAEISRRADADRMRRPRAPLARGFRASEPPASGESSRELHFVRIEESGEEIRALFRGDAFLRGMVRSICGVLATIARGKAPPDRIAELLVTGDRRLLSAKAPAHGLTLVRVHYNR